MYRGLRLTVSRSPDRKEWHSLRCELCSQQQVSEIKWDFFHGHHKFPNTLQLITHAGKGEEEEEEEKVVVGRREAEGRVLRKVFTRRETEGEVEWNNRAQSALSLSLLNNCAYVKTARLATGGEKETEA